LNETNSSNNRAVLTFPSWVPAAVKWQAEQLYAELAMHPDPAKAKQILARLASDPLMESVWHELFRKNRQSGEFFNPAMTAARRAAKKRRLATKLKRKGGAINERDARLWRKMLHWLKRMAMAHLIQLIGARKSAQHSFFRQAFLIAIEIKPVYLRDLQAYHQASISVPSAR
jgi:hypothetical protein